MIINDTNILIIMIISSLFGFIAGIIAEKMRVRKEIEVVYG